MSQNLKHKILTQEETPKYSFRKYSFGLASALIGLTAFSGGLKGTIAKADTVSNSAVADQKDIDAKQNNKQATLDISYSDEQKQTQDSNKNVAENKNDNQVSTEQKQAANVQAKNDSQVSHNENNESKEPAVTVKKQATAQRTNSNPVKEEQESKQVVTKPQNSNNTSTATKQVKNNETSATIANAMVNNGENRSAVAPKADENKNTTTLDTNKLSAESNNAKGNFLSLLNNFAVVKSASTKAPYDIDANWDYTITKGTKTVNESVTSTDSYLNHEIYIDSFGNTDETSGSGKNYRGVKSMSVNCHWFSSDNQEHVIYITVTDNHPKADGNLPIDHVSVGSSLGLGSNLKNNKSLNGSISVSGDTEAKATTTKSTTVESDTVNITGYKGTSNDVFIPNAADFKADGKNNVDAVHINPSLMRKLATRQGTTSITVSNTDGQFVDAVDDSNFTMDNSGNLPVYSVDSNGNPTNVNWNNTDLATGGNKTTGTDLFGHHDGWKYVFQNGHQGWYYVNNGVIYSDDKLPSKTENIVTGSTSHQEHSTQSYPLIDYNDVKNITRSPANVASTLKSVNTEGLHGADIDPLANNTIAREYKIIENLPDGTQKVLFDWNGQINQDPDGTYNQYPAQVTVTGANGQYTQPKNATNGNIDNGWWHITPDIKSGYTISVTPEYSTDDATKMGLELMPQYDSHNNLTHITFDLAPSKSMLQSQTFYVNYTAQTKQMKVGEDGITDHDLHRTITRTITITDPQGNTTNQTQTVSFNRTGTINTATGEKHFNPWQNDKDGKDTYTFDSVAVPAVNGYTASGSIPSEAVTPDSSDSSVSINYVANGQNVTINYVDANGKNVGTQVVSGKTAQTENINYQAPTNWHIVGNAPASYTFKADGNDPINVTVAHNLQDQADQSKTVTRTVTINVPNGSPIVKKQSATFTRHVQKDLVDGSTVYGNWDKSSAVLDAVDIPAVAGYTVNGSANQIAVTPDSQDQNITINYVANGQTSSYYFVDDDGNGQKVGEDHQISGKTDQTINFTVAAPANYELVNAQDANQSYTFKADGNTPVVIHLKHHRASATGAKNKDVDDHRIIIREIDIVSPDGKQTVEKQTVEFTRPATEDMVTGQITYGDWSDGGQKQMPALTLPDESGYHADITVPALTVTPDSKPEPVKVTYVASDQAVKLSFVDRSGAVVGTKTINGKTDQTYNVSLSDLPAHYEIDGSLPVYKFTDQADQALTVHVKQNKDDYTAIAQPITVKHGETPNASDGIKNTQDMPSGTSYAWGTEPQLPQGKTYGDTTGTVVVTFPDGSNENVTVPVHFNSEAEDNAKKGDQAVAFNGTKTYYHGQAVADLTLNDLTNADNVKSVVWANKPDTSKIGNGADSATVTFNDGTTTVINGNYTVTPNDSDKTGTIETQPITVKHGQDPASTDPKDGIKTALPDGTKVNWTTKPQLPSGQTYGDTKGTAEVDFPDGSKQSVEITVHVNSDAEDNAKKGDQAVAFNGTKTYYHGQAVADLTLNDLTNADNVKSVVWANKPDTSKIGSGADSATVTFNDGTTTVINGNYTVTPNDSDKIGTIETQPITVKHGQDPAGVDPKDGIKTALPDGTQVNWTSKPALPSGQTYGDTKGTAEVDFPDGSKQSVEITVHVNSDAEDNQNKSQHGEGVAFNGTKTYYHGQAVADLTLNDLTNADNVKSVVWANKPDTSKIGAGADSATVTFNDGTTTVINGNYTVTPNDSDKIGTIETQPITVKHGQDPASVDPKDGIKTALPDGTQVNWTSKPALPSGQTYGDTKGTAEVDFPDGSKQSVEIPVHVNSDAEDNKSKGDQGVSLKVTDKVYYHGENVPDLTLNDLINADNVKSVVWANKPDTSKIGAGSDSATVTFNDGTTATVGGSYVVNPNDSDKTGTIETQPITVKHGQDPASVDPKEGIKTTLPDGTQVNWTTKPALPSGQTYGDTKGTAEVTFPDGSKQSVEIPVHFNSQAEDNAKKGDQGVGFKNPSQVYSHNQTVPDLTLNDLNNPDNVKSVVWANKPDTSKTGAGTDSATVTFNDGSTVTIKGSYVVNSIDTTDLSKAIKDGQDAQKTTKYTNGSDKAKKDLDDALNKGIKDINNPDLNQDQADKDAKNIEDAIKNLDGKATDTTNLDQAIKDGKDAQKTVHYDNSSDKAKKDLDNAINKAVKDKKNPNLSQDQADKDAKDIEDAIKNLDGKATDTSNLNKAIKDGQNAQKSDKYKNSTSKAQKTLDDAINKAINDLKNPNLTQKQADQDARAIEDAIKGLDGKANNNKQIQGTKTNTKTDGNGVVQASTIGNKANSNELPQTGESNNTIALASGIATALTAGIGMLAEGKKRKRE